MMFRFLNGKRVSVFGYGVTMRPLVALLKRFGVSVAIYDDKPSGEILDSALFDAGASDLELVSPGLAPAHSLVRAARNLTSEYDFIYSVYKPHLSVWISGTNGKTTTTEMATALLVHYGAVSGGNIGTPLAELVERGALLRYCDDDSGANHASCADSTNAVIASEPRSGEACHAQSTCEAVPRRHCEPHAVGRGNPLVDSSNGFHASPTLNAIDCHAVAGATARNDDSRANHASCVEAVPRRHCEPHAVGRGNPLVDSSNGFHASPTLNTIDCHAVANATARNDDSKTASSVDCHAVASATARNDGNIWILETSSFTLHYTKNAAPEIYALLPLSQDHISWHGSFENYITDKLSPLTRMGKHTHAILPNELKNHNFIESYKGNKIFYKDSSDLAKFLGIQTEKINFKEPFLLDALIALTIAKSAGHALDLDTLNAFEIGKHRIEEFHNKDGFLFVDDSKGTNVDATIAALKRYANSCVLLVLGGDDKGADLTPLFSFMKETFNKQNLEIYAIGSNAKRLESLSAEYNLNCQNCSTLESAMEKIKQKLPTQDKQKNVVLLSPAAASLDQFSSYKERGEKFQKLALEN